MDEHPPLVTIDDDVEWLTEQIHALKQLGQRDEVDEGAKYDFSIRWGTALAGRLPRLLHYSSRGQLAPADERRFQALCDELRGLSDVIDRIGFAQPSWSDAAPGTAKRGRVLRPSMSRRGLPFGRR